MPRVAVIARPREGGAAAVILARPLFAPNRQPPPQNGEAHPRGRALPRLAGTMILPDHHFAIFSDGQGTASREEGQTLDGLRVEKVAPGRAVLRNGASLLTLAVTRGIAAPGAAQGVYVPAAETGLPMPHTPVGRHEE